MGIAFVFYLAAVGESLPSVPLDTSAESYPVRAAMNKFWSGVFLTFQ